MTSSVPLVRAWKPDKRETRESYLAYWKLAQPTGRRRSRRMWRVSAAIYALLIVGSAIAGAVPFAIVAGGLFGLSVYFAFDRLCVMSFVRIASRARNAYSEIRLVADVYGLRWARPGEEHSYTWDDTRLYRDDTMVLVAFGEAGFMAVPTSVLGPDGVEVLGRLWVDATTIQTLPPDEYRASTD